MTRAGDDGDSWADVNIGPGQKGIGYFVDDAAAARYATAYRAAAEQLPPGSVRMLQTSRGRVRAQRFGPDRVRASAPLLLVSGRNAGTPSWAPALPSLLSLDRPIHVLDSPGEAGRSVQTAPLDDPADQATWVAEAAYELGAERVHLVGHSLGGWVAAQVLRHRPEVLASVTVLDPPSTFAPLAIGFQAAGLAVVVLPLPDGVRRGLLRWIAGGSRGTGPIPGSEVLEDLGLIGLETFRVRQPPPVRPAEEELNPGRVLALAVLGGRSRVHDPVSVGTVAARTGWRVETWPDAGHTLHVDHAGRLARLLDEHLAAAGF